MLGDKSIFCICVKKISRSLWSFAFKTPDAKSKLPGLFREKGEYFKMHATVVMKEATLTPSHFEHLYVTKSGTPALISTLLTLLHTTMNERHVQRERERLGDGKES